MGAFGGVCAWDGQPADDHDFSELAAYLRVGGPDRSAMAKPFPWLAVQSHALHFDTLSEHERQPHVFAAGSILTWDGRLDNREDLLITLHRDLVGYDSDAAIVAAAYERWGTEAIGRLVGDWALAIWDAHQRRIILARDFMGNRPLYYRAELRRLCWATRLEALAASERLFGAPDDVYLGGYLANKTFRELTPFAGLCSLLAGHILIGNHAETKIYRYWKYTPTTVRYARPDDYAEHLRGLLTEGIRARLRASQRVWAHLSGGWDSSAVVCLAHRLIERRCVEAPSLQPLSWVFGDREAALERGYVTAVEDWCNRRTVPNEYRERPAFSEMLGYAVLGVNHEGFGLEVPVQAAGDRIVLSGFLGDLAMGQPGNALLPVWERFSEGHPLDFVRILLAYAHATKRPALMMFKCAVRDKLLETFQSLSANFSITRGLSLTRRSLPDLEGLSLPLKAKVQARPRIESPSSLDFPTTHRPLVDELYRSADSGSLTSPEYLVPVIWRTHPYTHRPLIEFLLAIPRLALFEPTFARAGMRRALNDVLPPAILARGTKVGVPDTSQLRAERRWAELAKDASPITETASQWYLVQRGVVDPTILATHVGKMRAGARPSEFLRKSINLEAWLRTVSRRTSETIQRSDPFSAERHMHPTSALLG